MCWLHSKLTTNYTQCECKVSVNLVSFRSAEQAAKSKDNQAKIDYTSSRS